MNAPLYDFSLAPTLLKPFHHFHDRALARKGGAESMNKLLPVPLSSKALCATTDDRWLSTMSQCVFQAGFSWKVINQKWPDFEEVFSGFHPRGMACLSDERLEELAMEKRIVRNPQKIRTVRDNAIFINDIVLEHDSFGAFAANWPDEQLVDLLLLMKKRGSRLGGITGSRVLRQMGRDTFILARDVIAALNNANIIDSSNPTAKRDLLAAQNAFNEWQQQSGLPFCQMSRILSYSIDA